MISVVRRIAFSAGHRLYGHENCCAHLHGHNYVAYFHAKAEKLDALGRVVDFAVLKERLGGWIDAHWDHGFIVYREDAEARNALEAVRGQKVFLLDENPTVENLARYLLHVVAPQQLADTAVSVHRIELWETENCCAEVSL
jgi:6-pyruvoyltetrahydropterin/6-carboxytetrahydropterin synthase